MKRIYLLFLLAAMLLVQSCGTSGEASTATIPQGAIPVQVIDLKPASTAVSIQGTGQFTTDDETFLSFKTGGIISQVLVSEGDAVRKGQLLATLDLTEIQTTVTQYQLAYEKALRDYERVQRLLKDSVATLEQAQNSKTALDISLQALDAARFNRDFSQIRALRDGFVLKKMANAGQQISSGVPVFQTVGSNQSSWKLKVNLSDRDWAAIREGDPAEIFPATAPDRAFAAKVYKKAQIADAATGTYQVTLEFTSEATPQLASGMFGTAIIQSVNARDSWLIPYESILDANGGKGYVFVTEDGKVARKIQVTLGKILTDQVQVTDGLQNFRQLIVSGSAYLNDLSPIQIPAKP